MVPVARFGDLTIPEVATDFGITDESVPRWMRQADIDDIVASAEQSELVRLRWERQLLEMQNEILRRAAVFFASSTLSK